MPVLIAGLALFIGVHSFTMQRGPRAALIARFGEGPYKMAYSVLSLVGLILIAHGFGLYRRDDWIEVWHPPVWTRHLALLLVWAAFVSFAAAYLPGRIKATLKHPMLNSVKFWATAHLLANGDLGSILLFGAFLSWAVLARISVKRREVVRDHGGPLARPAGWRNDLIALGVGTLAFYAFARWLHPMWIGVPVWPGS